MTKEVLSVIKDRLITQALALPNQMPDQDHHDSGPKPRTPLAGQKLAIVAGINIIGFVVELFGGLVFGSVALMSDAVHMLFDGLAYVMAFAAEYVAERYEGSELWTYDFHRIEPFAAFINGVLLIPMVGFILWESYQRILNPVDIGTLPTIIIAIGGLIINIGSVFILHDEEMSLNTKGAFYHLLGDAGGSIAVIVSATIINLTGVTVVDPIMAVLISGLILWSAGKILRESGAIFFLRTPLDPEKIRFAIENIDGICRVEDLHAWQICSQIRVATVHVETSVETVEEGESINQQIHHVLSEYGVDHATIELSPEYADRQIYLNSHTH